MCRIPILRGRIYRMSRSGIYHIAGDLVPGLPKRMEVYVPNHRDTRPGGSMVCDRIKYIGIGYNIIFMKYIPPVKN